MKPRRTSLALVPLARRLPLGAKRAVMRVGACIALPAGLVRGAKMFVARRWYVRRRRVRSR